MAFTEVENGERLKQDKAKKDAEEKHNAALEQQKAAMMQQMKDSEALFEK